jgi:hypothetical protein
MMSIKKREVFAVAFLVPILLIFCLVGTVSAVVPLMKAPVITAELKANPASYTGTCPAVIKFEGTISVKGIVKGPYTLKYIFTRSDGATDTNVKTLTFAQDGTQKVSTTWTLGGAALPTYSGWQKIKVLTVPPVESSQADFSVKCETGRTMGPKLPFKAELSDLKMANVLITKETKMKIAPQFAVQLPANLADRRADLKCHILAYHDQARLRPISGNIWYLNPNSYSPPLPLPWYIYYDIVVTNTGTAATGNFVTKIHFSNPTKPPQDFYEAESLDPGESVVFKFYWGYFLPGMYNELFNQTVTISSQLDATAKVAESNEANNACAYPVKFVQ